MHLHTVYSDSTYTPEELMREAKCAGLSAVAIVDHDTVEGISPVEAAAKKIDIEVIPGIELTAQHQGKEVHLLGYLIDYQKKGLREKLDSLWRIRVERVHKIAGKLKALGLNLEAEEVFALAKNATVGRLHIARIMVNKGMVSSTSEAFRKYIGEDCPAYVLGFRLSVLEATQLIQDLGGIAVLAHPYSLNNNYLIPEFVDYGIEGLEAYYPEHTPAMTNLYLDLAQKFNLVVTGGSDCHGQTKPGAKIGSVKIPYALVEKLKERKEK